jgi:hypothetical protein
MRIPSGKTDQRLYFIAVDATDFVTRETGLSSFTVVRSRNGAADVTYTTPTITEIDSTTMPGVYALLVDEDTTVGSSSDSEEYCVHITHAGMAPVTRTIELYRRSVTSGETVDVSSGGVEVGSFQANAITATAIASDAITAAKIADSAIDRTTFAVDTGLRTIRSGTAQAGAAGTITLDASAAATTDFYDGDLIYTTGGTGVGQVRIITAYNGTTKVATITPNWATTPDNTTTYAVLPAGHVNLTAIAGAVLSTTTAQIGANAVQAGGTAWGSGAITSGAFATGAITAGAIAADTIGASELAADAATEIATAVWATAARTLTALDEDNTTLDLDATIRAAVGLASANLDTQIGDLPTNAELATALGTADDAVLTQVALVKAVTDKLDDTLEDDGGTYRFTANALEEAPTGGSAPTADEIANQVWDELVADHLGAGSMGDAIFVAATQAAAANAAVGVVDGVVDAIKLKTDSLTFTVANQIDANIQYVNDTEVTGSGTGGDPWGP